jgi:hypothetical protein
MLKFRISLIVALSLFALPAYSQVREAGTNNGATIVNCVQGCSGGTTATENGTVAPGTSTATGISFLYLYEAPNWKRVTGTAAGGINVICTSGCGSPAATPDNTAFTAGTTNVSPTAFVYNDSITALTSGRYGAARVNANRILYLDLSKTSQNATPIITTPYFDYTTYGGTQTLGALNDAAVTNLASGTFYIPSGLVGTVTFEISSNGGISNWATEGVFLSDGTYKTSVSSFPVAGSWGVAGFHRIKVTAYTSGSTTPDILDWQAPGMGHGININALSLPLPTNAATDRSTAAAPFATRLSTGAAFYNALQASDTLTKVTTVDTITNAVTLANTLVSNPLAVNITDGTNFLGTNANPLKINFPTGSSGAVVVNGYNGASATSFGAGASGTSTQRVVTATDSTIGTVTSVTQNTDVRQTTASNFNAQVVGNIASAATDSGNPVKVGGVYNSTQPTFTNGQRGDLQLSPRGAVYVTNGTESISVICTSGCTPGGSFADNSTFTLGTSAINNTGYLLNDNITTALTSGNAGIGRMSATRIPYSDLSKDSSNLLAYLAISARADIAALGGRTSGDRPGYYIRSGLAGQLVSQNNPLPVTLPDAPDPCNKRKGNVAISQTATTKLISGKPGQLIALCYARVVNATAEIVNELEGTGTNCGTATVAVSGSTTAANGESLAANGGFSAGVGIGTIATTNVPGNDFCLGQSGTARVSGNITYVYYQP